MSFSESSQFRFRIGHERITWATRSLILANIAVFAVGLLYDLATALIDKPGLTRVFDFAAFSTDTIALGYFWTPLSYMFLHAGLYHVFFNMLMLYFFGPEVERVLGSRQFIRFFLLCGAVGVLANYVPTWFSDAPPLLPENFEYVVGASGATLGVLVAFAMIDPDRQVILFPLPFPINSRALVFIIVFINIMNAVNPTSRTSVATHFGGMAVGFAYMKYIPLWTKYRAARLLARKKARGPSEADMNKLGDEIDNIFKLQDRDRRK